MTRASASAASGDRRPRWTRLTLALFALFILAASAASNRHERVVYAALPLALVLLCAGRVWWLHGVEVLRRQSFVWRFRQYSGRHAAPFGRGMQAAGVAFGLLGLWALGIWWVER